MTAPNTAGLTIYRELEQKSPEWLQARAGIITASVVGNLITRSTPDPTTAQCPSAPGGAAAITGPSSSPISRKASTRGSVATITAQVPASEAIAPAPDLSPKLAERASALGLSIAESLGVTGVLAVELFAFNGEGGEDISVNELAMRPHNTGHWTQDGCVTSQFEQHLRAVLDLPLGAVDALAPVTVMANVLGADEDPEMPMPQRVREVMERYPHAKIHLYDKDHRAGRKIGHVNVSGSDLADLRGWALGWGLGLELVRRERQTWVGHTGGLPGSITGFFTHRESGTTGMALMNSSVAGDPAELFATEGRPRREFSDLLGAIQASRGALDSLEARAVVALQETTRRERWEQARDDARVQAVYLGSGATSGGH